MRTPRVAARRKRQDHGPPDVGFGVRQFLVVHFEVVMRARLQAQHEHKVALDLELRRLLSRTPIKARRRLLMV